MATGNQQLSFQTKANGRRLFSFSQHYEHIWGRCDYWDRGNTGCVLKEPSTCSDYLSDGPASANLEIKIGGLSEPGSLEATHLQWWAARKSRSEYNPLHEPHSVIASDIYPSVLDAYPRYDDLDFNGGNVKVDANGEAIIRFSAPSTFMMYCYIAYPHIHLRTCLGGNFTSMRRDTIVFDQWGPWIQDGCMKGSRFSILGYRYVGDSDWISVGGAETAYDYPTPSPTQSPTLIATTTAPTQSPTLAPQVVEASVNLQVESVQEGAVIDLRIQSAKEALDLEALEFSPVYNCFLQGKFFDQFSSGCAVECPESSAVKHGQCVKKELGTELQTLTAAWKLKVDCSAECWEKAKTPTLHQLRLAVADHLDIPFQEVAVAVNLLSSRRLVGKEHRRLDDHDMHFIVVVDSRRVSAEDDTEHLRNTFIVEADDATFHFGLQVNEVIADHGMANPAIEAPADPYTKAYDQLEPKVVASPLATTSDVPSTAIIVAAIVIALIGLTFGLFLRYRRRASLKKQKELAEAEEAKTSSEKIGSDEGAVVKVVDPDGIIVTTTDGAYTDEGTIGICEGIVKPSATNAPEGKSLAMV